MKNIKYEFDRPLLRTEKGDVVEISVTHFVKSIIREKDIKNMVIFLMEYTKQ